MKLAGQSIWGQHLKDSLSDEEIKENRHILDEGDQAEIKHNKKQIVNKNIFNGEFTLTCTPAAVGNKFLVMVSYMPGFKAPSSDDMSGFVELYGGLTSSQSQLWEVEMRTDNMGKLGDYLNHMPFAVVRNFSFTTTSTAEHTFKVRCKCSTSARWIYHLMNGGDITIMELQG